MRGWMGARGQFDMGDEDESEAENSIPDAICPRCGWYLEDKNGLPVPMRETLDDLVKRLWQVNKEQWGAGFATFREIWQTVYSAGQSNK